MAYRKGEIIELTLEKMAYGGQALGRLDGFVVFVRGAVPGDRVSARIYRKKKDYAEAALEEILSPSSDRVEAPCPYFGFCGGCQWQHVRYNRQLEYKRTQIQEIMARIGGLRDVPVRPTRPSQKRLGYRNKMEFSFSDRRWFLPDEMHQRNTEGNFALGLHVPGTFHKVIDVEACLLQAPEGNRILREVKAYVKDSGISVYGLRTHEGYWRFLMVRHATAYDQWMVNIVTSDDRPRVIRGLAEILSGRFANLKTVVNNINRRKAATAVGEQEKILVGDGYIKDKMGPFTFRISANSFFQTNPWAGRTLYETAIDFAEPTLSDRVLDLYSGTGTIPIFLADKVLSVTGIELSPSAIADAEKNCRENGIANCRFICGDVRERLPTISLRPHTLIIDPPRSGLHKRVLAQIMDIGAGKVVYISCNPVTMARDMGLMAGDYEIVEIQPVDMFPHTHHIEAVAKLHAKKRG